MVLDKAFFPPHHIHMLIRWKNPFHLIHGKLRYINQLLIASGTGMNICQKYVKERTNFSYL